ncbi:hypothetical protein NPIL_107761 [Nephila pilipes]|uniref:Secreted protein n=1 Tax=Nephila pilipes TaxID=299642 RepID=A0A8X6UIY2_NEPPI|nr:hypothetical protein NPIL_107761 [Nephila pilipes]
MVNPFVDSVLWFWLLLVGIFPPLGSVVASADNVKSHGGGGYGHKLGLCLLSASVPFRKPQESRYLVNDGHYP